MDESERERESGVGGRDCSTFKKQYSGTKYRKTFIHLADVVISLAQLADLNC